ncbi:Putative beta-barrel porin-2, OmpL-like. bbp2 [Flavobacterium swingsii]|uniref:Putative beta-barrel porin-2, OmpL-like. bbp2 n=1 Tax=Flavobacterium swingsii TaxID=498292 RepID=A0A1I0WNU9_9FLAO|nr:porin [Flavobacterium swingsii]SFA90422.1 Putative beta-barrel porin-2, OmpL-like. bbp2 [Flavobacterium swingsii]
MRKITAITTFSVFLLIFNQKMWSQDSINNLKPKIDFSGCIETYYSYDFNKTDIGIRQPFLYTYNRHNEFNINLGLVKVSVSNAKYRANLALQAGTYVSDNYTAEDEELRLINEANVGISLNFKNNLWLDAGILPSHIGFESAIGANNQNLTRSILAENSPYFLTGAKLTYEPSSKWLMSVSVLNGWQRIRRLQGNSLLSLGTQLTYKKSDKVVFNWSTFIGSDSPDADRKMRYFNNLYCQYKATDKLNFTVGFDAGFQQKFKKANGYFVWYSPVLISQYQLSEKWSSSLRLEYYSDKYNVIVNPLATATPFEVSGSSLNFDYAPFKMAKIRFEARYLNASETIFVRNTFFKEDNLALTTSLSLQF